MTEKKETTLYIVNGVLLAVTFFVGRVLAYTYGLHHLLFRIRCGSSWHSCPPMVFPTFFSGCDSRDPSPTVLVAAYLSVLFQCLTMKPRSES